jgi:nucleoside-diphosphate-sugar epimerase
MSFLQKVFKLQLAIFGGTGRTGIHLVGEALKAGHRVRMLARNPAKVSLDHPALTIMQGDITSPAAVRETLQGVEAVLSMLGPAENKPTFKVSQGTGHVLSAMRELGIQRIIISAGAGVGDPGDRPGLSDWLINMLLKTVSRYVYEDMVRTVTLVRDSDRAWTIVRVPMLIDGPASGTVRAGYVGKEMGIRVCREDLAAFMLAQLEDDSFVRKAPVISASK